MLGLDCHGATPWETKEEILAVWDALTQNHATVLLIANSIGAYFAMNALQGKSVFQAMLISPIVYMEKLIRDRMVWAHVTEAELEERREIETAFGETLSWEYLQYVRSHPLAWTVPTHILYGDQDQLTSLETIQTFARAHGADLTILKGGEHWFHTAEQMTFHDEWVKACFRKYRSGHT